MPPETINQHIEAETQENTILPETEDEKENEGYTGFMKIRCDKCGKERTLCSRSPFDVFQMHGVWNKRLNLRVWLSYMLTVDVAVTPLFYKH